MSPNLFELCTRTAMQRGYSSFKNNGFILGQRKRKRVILFSYPVAVKNITGEELSNFTRVAVKLQSSF